MKVLSRDSEFRKGDRDTGYWLKRLFGVRLTTKYKVDLLIAKYPPGACQQPHVDQSSRNDIDIHRLAIVLRKPERGGALIGNGIKSMFFNRVNYIHASKNVHEVTKVEGTKTRYALLISLFIKGELT